MKYTTQEPPTEETIVDSVTALLRKAGYQIVPRLRIRQWRPDIVGVRGDEIVIVEAKGQGSDMRKALAQTALYSTDATSAYLALPSERIREDIKEAAKVLEIGLIGVGERAKIELEAVSSEPRASLLRRIRRAGNVPSRRIGKARGGGSPVPGRLLRHRRVLETLLAKPGRGFPIRELSLEARIPYSTTWRIAGDLESRGAIVSERVGTARVLSPNQQAPVLQELRRLAGLELSPHRLAAKEFAELLANVPRVQRAILFGSVARGSEAATSDVDVAVVLTRKDESVVNRIYELAEGVQDRTRMKIVPLFMNESELNSAGRLAGSVKSGEVLLERS